MITGVNKGIEKGHQTKGNINALVLDNNWLLLQLTNSILQLNNGGCSALLSLFTNC